MIAAILIVGAIIGMYCVKDKGPFGHQHTLAEWNRKRRKGLIDDWGDPISQSRGKS